MEIQIHGYVVTIKRMKIDDVEAMVTNELKIEFSRFKKTGYNGKLNLMYSFGTCKESVHIRCGSVDENGFYNYLTVNLHGSYFDNTPDFGPVNSFV